MEKIKKKKNKKIKKKKKKAGGGGGGGGRIAFLYKLYTNINGSEETLDLREEW